MIPPQNFSTTEFIQLDQSPEGLLKCFTFRTQMVSTSDNDLETVHAQTQKLCIVHTLMKIYLISEYLMKSVNITRPSMHTTDKIDKIVFGYTSTYMYVGTWRP